MTGRPLIALDGRHIAVAQMTGPATYGDQGVVGLYQMPQVSRA